MTKRVGHRGAHAVVEGNTLASFDTALDLGVDMIEFDVCAVRGRQVRGDQRAVEQVVAP